MYDGFDELDAIGPFEVFRIAETKGADLNTELVSLASDPAKITAQRGLVIQCKGTVTVDSPPDILLIPGGGWGTRSSSGAWCEYQKGEIPNLISEMYKKGTTIASVCTGAMLIAKTGILMGKKATTHHNAYEDLRSSGADVLKMRVVDQGRIITSGGITSGIDLAIWIIEKHYGKVLAESVENQLEYSRTGKIWHE